MPAAPSPTTNSASAYPNSLSPLHRRSRRRLYLVAAAAAAVVVIVVAAWALYAASHLTVTAGVTVAGSGAAFFRAAACASPATVNVGSYWTCAVTVSNLDGVDSHTVNGITVNAPFTQISQFPATPLDVGALNSASFTVTVQVPSVGGSYALQFTVLTSH